MDNDNKTKSKSIQAEKILISIGLLALGLIIVYNAFFIPDISPETINTGTISSEKTTKTKNIKSEFIKNGKVNINTADQETLAENIPNVGSKKAELIVAYREKCGKFSSTEELMNIKGIGQKFFNNIKDYVTV